MDDSQATICPHCLAPGNIICLHCGMDLRPRPVDDCAHDNTDSDRDELNMHGDDADVAIGINIQPASDKTN
jgi:hypothetical protein